ncbi:BRO family protein [Dysosmobacter sp.]|uniref:BRO family protein n=1 Tax=Dysosmobacter sp. TaxID=2591382 RepID=UPI002F931E2F
MNEMQVFQNSEFGELGVLEIEGKPWFPATACARKLGYANPQKAIRDHCKGVNEMVTPTNGGTQTMRFIPEGDLYRLITHSKLPGAERFEKWVFDEVLPSIRKTGGYGSQAALGHLVEQLTQVTAALMQVASIMATASSESAVMEEPKRRKRATSIIDRLDVEARKEVEAMICSGQYTYMEIAQHLADCGIKISVTSVWRYAQAMN